MTTSHLNLITRFSLGIFIFFISTSFAENSPDKRLCGFGSSVCNGQGDEISNGGYMGRLKSRLEEKGWVVMNASRGGDNTIKIQERWDTSSPKRSNITIKPNEYLLPNQPKYVLVGLSLNNEGIRRAKGDEGKAAIVSQWTAGMNGIFSRLTSLGITPIMGNCYANGAFTEEDYDDTITMNLKIHLWDTPSINFLGALDNGNGKWCEGFWHDVSHPNSAGHTELMEVIVPSLFDAIAQGKTPPVKTQSSSYLTASANEASGIFCEPEYKLHAFTVAVMIKATGDASLLDLKTIPQEIMVHDVKEKKSTIKVAEFKKTVDEKTFTLSLTGNSIFFDGKTVGTLNADSKWHQVVIVGRPAAQFLKVFIDEKETLTLSTSVFLKNVTLIPRVKETIGLKDFYLYRSALNPEEIKALYEGKLLRSSLEVYAPLHDLKVTKTSSLANLAQSLTSVRTLADNLLPTSSTP